MGESTLSIIELCQHAEDGDWPVSGGILDQSQSFMQALRRYRSEIHRLKELDADGG